MLVSMKDNSKTLNLKSLHKYNGNAALVINTKCLL